MNRDELSPTPVEINTTYEHADDPQEEDDTPTTIYYRPESFELILKFLIFIFFIHTFLVQSYVIPTSSMENTLLVGDHIMVDKVAYSHSYGIVDSLFLPQKKIGRGMVVTFKAPNDQKKLYVKRVIGLPGESLYIRYQQVYINDKPLEEPYVIHSDPKNKSVPGRDHFPKYKVPEGYYFCLGDNRDDSVDSRYWGSVPEEFIVGAPWRIYWSYRTDGKEYLNASFLERLEDIFMTVFNIFSGTRWERTIMRVH